jgi:hypothetical protein
MDSLLKIWKYLLERKKWWLFPVIFLLLVIGVLIVLAGGTAVAPFIYTLF